MDYFLRQCSVHSKIKREVQMLRDLQWETHCKFKIFQVKNAFNTPHIIAQPRLLQLCSEHNIQKSWQYSSLQWRGCFSLMITYLAAWAPQFASLPLPSIMRDSCTVYYKPGRKINANSFPIIINLKNCKLNPHKWGTACTEVSHTFPIPHMNNLNHFQYPHQSGIFVVNDEPTLTYLYHCECKVYLGCVMVLFILWV